MTMTSPQAPSRSTHSRTDLAIQDFAKSCPKIPVLAPTWKTCGKTSCRCQRGDLHGPYWTVRWREGSIHRRRYVRPSDVPAVRAILITRHHLRQQERQEAAETLAIWRALRQLSRDVEAQMMERRTRQ